MQVTRQGDTHTLQCHCGGTTFALNFLGAIPGYPTQLMATCSTCGDHVLINHEYIEDQEDEEYDYYRRYKW